MSVSVLFVGLMLQAPEMRIELSPFPVPRIRTTIDLTKPAYDFQCVFTEIDGTGERIHVRLRGNRGYRTGIVERPVATTPLTAIVDVNETPAKLSDGTKVRTSDGAWIFESRSNNDSLVHLVIQPDWSAPNYEVDGKSAAELNWGPIVGDAGRRWFKNSRDGSCVITMIDQHPLSETETQEFLSQ